MWGVGRRGPGPRVHGTESLFFSLYFLALAACQAQASETRHTTSSCRGYSALLLHFEKRQQILISISIFLAVKS